MRDEFYADRRDLWKWTVALNEAGEWKIVYAAMYRPNGIPRVPDGVRDDVRNFFLAEWGEIYRARKCSRIQKLSGKILPFLETSNHRNAAEYVRDVCKQMSSRGADDQFLILIDPDTGICDAKPTHQHVTCGQLGLIWNSMRPGDKLLIYQHHARQKRDEWVAGKLRTLTDAGMPASSVRCEHHADVCFFCISK